jgi:hypothetical protein
MYGLVTVIPVTTNRNPGVGIFNSLINQLSIPNPQAPQQKFGLALLE